MENTTVKRKRRSLVNKNAIVLLFLAAAAFLVLFVLGFIYELTGSLFGNNVRYYDGILEFGLNNGLPFSLVCATFMYLFVRLYTIDILISQDGANIFKKTSMWMLTVWILNLIVYFFTDYFHLQIVILILSVLFFLIGVFLRIIAERYAMFAATYKVPENFSDMNVPMFFSFVEFLFKKEQPPMPPME